MRVNVGFSHWIFIVLLPSRPAHTYIQVRSSLYDVTSMQQTYFNAENCFCVAETALSQTGSCSYFVHEVVHSL